MSESTIAVPPLEATRPIESRTVLRSLVGPVIVPSVFENGTTTMRSAGRRYSASLLAAPRAKSIRRAMLWLLSMSRANVAGSSSLPARSIACATPSSKTRKSARAESFDESSVLVLNGRIDQDASDVGRFNDFERL